MNDSEQITAIAEWVGKKRCPIHLGFECCGQTVPDYLRDLAAMWTVEELLLTRSLNAQNDELWVNYTFNLIWLCGGATIFFHATAAQRAEALLKTIGRWKD